MHRHRGRGKGDRAFLAAVGATEQYRPTLIFLTKQAVVRLAVPGFATAVACPRASWLAAVFPTEGETKCRSSSMCTKACSE